MKTTGGILYLILGTMIIEAPIISAIGASPASTPVLKPTLTICHGTMTIAAQTLQSKTEIKPVSFPCPGLLATDSVLVNTPSDLFKIQGYMPTGAPLPSFNPVAGVGAIWVNEANVSAQPITTAAMQLTVRGIR